ncbi:MAG: hypothetical protein HYX72_13390 [Acidobacteria bacterium]|nr:hypothetical protein [Acidobacteriota bacterium]
MAHPQIAAFARLAEGNVKPRRSIAGQNTLITRTIHDLAYDPVRDEIIVPQLFAQAILTFRGGADGDEAPIRILQGPKTQLSDPERLALDPVHGEIFVPAIDRVLVFPRDGQGDVAPIRILEGPDTQLRGEGNVAVDPVHNLLFMNGVARVPGRGRMGQVLVFDRTASGNAKPKAILRGPMTQIDNPYKMVVYPPRKLLLVGIRTEHAASEDSFVGVWSIYDTGNVSPRWTIGGPKGILRQPRGITLDPKNKNVIIADKYLNSVFTFSFPEVF